MSWVWAGLRVFWGLGGNLDDEATSMLKECEVLFFFFFSDCNIDRRLLMSFSSLNICMSLHLDLISK